MASSEFPYDTGAGLGDLQPQWSLARQFLLAHFAIILVAVLVIGAWMGRQIEESALDRTASVTSLYVGSVISPRLQDLARAEWLTPDQMADLDHLISGTALGQGIVVFKIWSPDGRVLYSPDRALVGRAFPTSEGFQKALQGQATADISDLREPENQDERQTFSHLIEVYAPVLRDRDGELIAVNEFYLRPDQLEAEINLARVQGWAIIGCLGALLYVVSAGIVKRGSDTIDRQRLRLEQQVDQLALLHRRVLQAGSRTTRLNELSLRRISADLHDGPAQVLALALLRLDALRTTAGDQADFDIVHDAVRDALRDVRAISGGLRLPELECVPLAEVLERTIADHERRTGVHVDRQVETLPQRAPLAVKIALVRTTQEALSNATRHAGAAGLLVRARCDADHLYLEVVDGGPGFDPAATGPNQHLGLAGMRERAELLGGGFSIDGRPGGGTSVQACWPLLERDGA